MTRVKKSHFGGETKAADGVIATLELDGQRFCKQFAQVVSQERTYAGTHGRSTWRKTIKKPIETYSEQVIDYCDKTGAKVVCLSTPETILRDLQGTRADLGPRKNQKYLQDEVSMPEVHMLRGRLDLLVGRGT